MIDIGSVELFLTPLWEVINLLSIFKAFFFCNFRLKGIEVVVLFPNVSGFIEQLQRPFGSLGFISKDKMAIRNC